MTTAILSLVRMIALLTALSVAAVGLSLGLVSIRAAQPGHQQQYADPPPTNCRGPCD
jgi:hypothetical protein